MIEKERRYLFVYTEMENYIFREKSKLISNLHKILTDQKIDIVINNFTSNKYIYEVARNEGIRL